MNIKSLVILLMLFAGVLCACNKNKTEERWAEEEARLAEWIKEKKPHLTPISNGIYFEMIDNEYIDNIQPETGDNVLVDFVCYFLKDSTVEEVSYKNWQEHGALYPSTFREGGPELWSYDRWAPMGIGQLRENEKAIVYVPSRLLGLQDFKTRVYTIHLKKVIDPNLKLYQETLMDNYMKREFGETFDTITITDNGKDYHVLYHVSDEGAGASVDASVSTRTSEYYFMQYEDFAKSRNCFYNREKTGVNDNKSKFSSKISEMFKSVKKEGKIIAVMPYRIMYGEDPYKDSNTGQYIAPLNSVLMYEISIDY